MQTRSIVLVDANVIIECHRTGAWNGLSGGYRVQTTEVCVSETQTGYQNRNFEQHIDAEQLRQSLDAVQTVSNRDYALLEMSRADLPELDDGERSLWAHALTRTDSHWLFCGPDNASLRCGIMLGYREQLSSLEGILLDVGHQCSTPLRRHYTRRWHERKTSELTLDCSGAW